jgi:hypothetical protein
MIFMKRAALLILAILTLVPHARAAESVPFIEDDYATAIARAKTKQLPLFVEAWAPW